MNRPNNAIIDLVRNLPIPTPWDLTTFVDGVAHMRGRPITLVAADAALPGPDYRAVWIKRDNDDIIAYRIEASDCLDDFICHQIGHMLLEHHEPLSAALSQAYFPDIEPALVQRVLAAPGEPAVSDRNINLDQREHDADMFAKLVRIAAAASSN